MEVKTFIIKNKVYTYHIIKKLSKKLTKCNFQLPTNITTIDKKKIVKELKQATKDLKLTKRNAAKLRQDHLRDRTKEADLVENHTLSHHIDILIIFEQHVALYKRIKKFTATLEHYNITRLEFPKDPTIGWHNIPKSLPLNQ